MTGIPRVSCCFPALNKCFSCFAFLVTDCLSMVQKFMETLNTKGFVITLGNSVEVDF
jgi:hypothetical protein